MTDTAPSSSSAAGSPGSGLRQLGFDSTAPLPAWVILNAVRNQAFSGEVTLHTMPAVRVWASDGTVYWAERAGATPVADRLVELGAITPAQMARGAVRLGDTMHLGRLFERVPNLDHDEIVNALGFVRDSLTAEVADLVTDRVDVVSGRHHASGIVFWFDAAQHAWPAPQPAPQPAPLPAPAAERSPLAGPPASPLSGPPASPLSGPPADPPADVVSAVRLALDEIRATIGAGATPAEPTDAVPMDIDPTDGEPTAPVMPSAEATQPASGLRRLIGGRRS